MGSGEVVKVKRDKIAACMTCPLCNHLLKEATTISLCLHTFCRKCIYEKFSDEDVDTCPVCEINLGCVPVDKLRPDHNLQDIRAKIFPFKRRKVEAPEIAETISPPTKVKERSLSSLVVNTPKVSSQGGATGRRTRAGVRKGSSTRDSSPAAEEDPTKEVDSTQDLMDRVNSPETLNKIKQNKKGSSTKYLQGSSTKPANDQTGGEHTGNNIEGQEGKVDLWKPLNTLVEAANRSKFSKPGSQDASPIKMEPTINGEADASMHRTTNEKNEARAEVQGEKSSMPPAKGPFKRKRMRQADKNKLIESAESSSSKIHLNVARRNWRDGPIWFSLVASGDQEGFDPLPQVSAAFLRIKDANLPVSSIQKYLMKQLKLASEEEVQIMCLGQPVTPQLKVSSLLDLWLRTSAASKKVQTFVGNPADDYVMVLTYARKVIPAP